MSGDFSRLTFNPAKHFSGVRMQQGRLQIDADWNEQMDILTHRMETEVGDFLGRHGVPISVNNGKGFAISVNANGGLQLGAGRYYIAGRLFENELDSAISGVPVPPSNSFNKPDAISRVRVPQSNSFYVAYLDTWQRHIAAAQDSSIVEVALGGPDTATRIKNEWLVRFEPTTQTDPVALRNGWQPVTVPISTGFMNARLNAQAFSLENQLYRIEIHEITDNGSMRFKWSRDNGSIIAAIVPPVDIEGGVITVTSIGRDDIQSFQANQWIELTTKAQTNQGQPGVFIQIQNINGHQITATQASWAAALTIWKATNIGASDFDLVRRWDMPNGLIEATISDANAQDGWQLIEQGIEVRFQPGTVGKQYKPGDYWLTTSRAAIGSIEWPHDQSGQPVAQPAHGIQHTFVPLALLQSDGKQWSVANDGDLRTTFRPMVDGLVNKSGDTMTGKLRIEDALEVIGDVRVGGSLNSVGQARFGEHNALTTVDINGTLSINGLSNMTVTDQIIASNPKPISVLRLTRPGLTDPRVGGDGIVSWTNAANFLMSRYDDQMTIGTRTQLDLELVHEREAAQHVMTWRSDRSVGIGTGIMGATLNVGVRIELSGSATGSLQEKAVFVTVNGNNISFVGLKKGINAFILRSTGLFKSRKNYDVSQATLGNTWNDWADWVIATAIYGDIVAVVSMDMIGAVPTGGSAQKLLDTIGATKYKQIIGQTNSNTSAAQPYALLFVKGSANKALEDVQASGGMNAQLQASYQQLLDSARPDVRIANDMVISGAAFLNSATVSGNTTLTTLQVSDNVGIGTATPEAKLDINGTLMVRDKVFLTSTLNVNGEATINSLSVLQNFMKIKYTYAATSEHKLHLMWGQVSWNGSNPILSSDKSSGITASVQNAPTRIRLSYTGAATIARPPFVMVFNEQGSLISPGDVTTQYFDIALPSPSTTTSFRFIVMGIQ